MDNTNLKDFEPGEGWREVPVSDYTLAYQHKQRRVAYTGEDGVGHYWVREEPVPPLPTEEGTTIRVTWLASGLSSMLALENKRWFGKQISALTAHELQQDITGFEVLAAPVDHEAVEYDRQESVRLAEKRVRRETVRAVLNMVQANFRFDVIAGHYGVEL